MSRAPFQVLVLPFRITATGEVVFAIFRRAQPDCWQGIAGGGNVGETPEEAARREAFEEAGIPHKSRLIKLDSVASIPKTEFLDSRLWGPNVYVIPEYSFGVEVTEGDIVLSHEHTEYVWLPYEPARELLRWHGNRVALWELNQRLTESSAT